MTSTTAPRTEPAHVTRPQRGGWISPTFRVVGLVATLGLIAALEVNAGKAAGWGNLAYGLPLAVDTFVLGVLLSPRSRLADRLFALGLVETTVVISAVWGEHVKATDGKEPVVLLGAALATLLVAALWRQDETIRREREHGDLLAAATAHADACERRIRELEDRSTTAEASYAEAHDTAARATADAAAAYAARDAHAQTIDTLRGELDRAAARADAAAAGRRRDDRESLRPAARVPRPESSTTDKDREGIIGLVLGGGTHTPTGTVFKANPAAGRRPIAQAIRDLGHTPGGNEELSALIEKVRADLVRRGHHIAAVRTGTD